MKIIFKTERLLLREFELTDWQFVKELVNMPDWIQFIGDKNVHSKTVAENYISKLQSSYQKDDFGFWLVELNDAKTPIGMCGFIKRENIDLPDIGFAFLEAYIGKGFATESANTTLQIAKEKFNHSKLCAITNNDNFKSIKLLKKIGFSFRKTIEMDNEVLNYYTN